MHEVRLYIYWLLNGDQCRTQIEANMARLLKAHEEVTKLRPEGIVRGFCKRMIGDIQRLQTSKNHCNSKDFCEKLQELLQELQNKLQDIQRTFKPPRPRETRV